MFFIATARCMSLLSVQPAIRSFLNYGRLPAMHVDIILAQIIKVDLPVPRLQGWLIPPSDIVLAQIIKVDFPAPGF